MAGWFDGLMAGWFYGFMAGLFGIRPSSVRRTWKNLDKARQILVFSITVGWLTEN